MKLACLSEICASPIFNPFNPDLSIRKPAASFLFGFLKILPADLYFNGCFCFLDSDACNLFSLINFLFPTLHLNIAFNNISSEEKVDSLYEKEISFNV